MNTQDILIAARREFLSMPISLACFRTYGNTSDGGSTDPEKNIALFNIVKKARADGVPKANIESALQKVCMHVLFLSSICMLFLLR